MRPRSLFITLTLVFLAACGADSPVVPVSELPNPAIYALSLAELPDVGLTWQQTYNQTTTNEGYKWSYLAYQAYQPGNLGVELESGFAINNDVVLYETDMSRAELPQPPTSMGNIPSVTWRSASLSHRLGDKSAVWKTTLGELLTPVWWLEFYQGHAYVRISTLGFPDQIAPSILYGLGDIVVQRLPRNSDRLRSDAGTAVATASPAPTATQLATTPAGEAHPTETPTTGEPFSSLPVQGYNAPAGETGMVSFTDESGNQLTDGITGSNDMLADLGSGAGYEWVGWTDQTEPVTLTFNLAGDESIGAVSIGIMHRDGLGVFVPEEVTINGTSVALQAEAVPNNQRADLRFDGPFHGPTVTIVLHHRGRGWMLVDEVRFLPSR